MRVAVLGFDGPLARATRVALERRGHTVSEGTPDCAVYFPPGGAGGSAGQELDRIVASGRFPRLVIRSHAYVYGSSTKNPGMMTEERVSLLPADAPEQQWLRLEEIAARHHNAAILRETCNKAILLQEGSVVRSGPVDEVLAAYLGSPLAPTTPSSAAVMLPADGP